MKIVFLDRATLSPETNLRPPRFKHELVCFDNTAPEQVSARIADADIVVTNKVKLSAESLSLAKQLKFVAVAATGTDNVDLKACANQGVTVSNIRNYAGNTVPEHTFALIFALRRSIAAYRESVRAGRWQDSQQFCYFDYPIRDLHGATIGIIGDGVLGKGVAAIAQALGMRVLFSAFKGRDGMGSLYTPFSEVLERSDIITLHCPLTEQTRSMISTAEFAMMKRRPLLINTARGGLVDEVALVEAMKLGQVSGAGFDVVTVEPPPLDHPFMTLMDTPNFILTPHVAWASQEAIQGLADQLVENIEAFVAGHPVNVVTGAA
ncbi:glycerate dehydrogenase [Comamonas testosteroni]|uniref:Glycerate dehydrogenase n=1 Tax=Comamonas testosteroni TaxID=285 RepID=A0A5A7MJZ1_COMTE|nr:D-2-hydroxyacid dehydrogenase [Comamonas testosteroni]GEQ78137.1 glycerate dehydrogenase [Comamonas testosteroni]